MVNLHLEEADIDTILALLDRKIEKVEAKEIDQSMIEYLNQLKSIKNDILAQVSN